MSKDITGDCSRIKRRPESGSNFKDTYRDKKILCLVPRRTRVILNRLTAIKMPLSHEGAFIPYRSSLHDGAKVRRRLNLLALVKILQMSREHKAMLIARGIKRPCHWRVLGPINGTLVMISSYVLRLTKFKAKRKKMEEGRRTKPEGE